MRFFYSTPRTAGLIRALVLAVTSCAKAQAVPVLAVPQGGLQHDSLPQQPAKTSFMAAELRNMTASSLRNWFSYFGDRFPVNVEVIDNESGFGADSRGAAIPRRSGLVISAGKMSLQDIVGVSCEKLGGALYKERGGANLIFHLDKEVSNPFENKLKEKIEGNYSFNQAFARIKNISKIDLYPFSRITDPGADSKSLPFSVPAGSRLRDALNILAKRWNHHWSAAVIGRLKGSDVSDGTRETESTFVIVQFH
jgi:hypothetical protein